MKKRNILLLALVLMLAAALLLCSCDKTPGPSDTSTDPSTDTSTGDTTVDVTPKGAELILDGSSNFVIVSERNENSNLHKGPIR